MAVGPRDNGLVLTILSCVFLGLSYIVVVVRTTFRVRTKAFGVDDWLMIIGLLLFTGLCVSSILCTVHGAGSRVVQLEPYYIGQTRLWFLLIQVFYTTAIAPIKSSICVTLLRIANRKGHRVALYLIIFVSCASTVIADVGTFTQARPLSSLWDPSITNDPNTLNVRWFTYFITGSSIIIDLAIAVMPGLILRKVQLPRAVKLSIIIMLTLGAIPCVAAIARLVLLLNFEIQTGFYGRTAQFICSVSELGTGIIAGSLGTLGPLLRRFHRCITPGATRGTSGASVKQPIASRPPSGPLRHVHTDISIMLSEDENSGA